jgi:hypothetical protein
LIWGLKKGDPPEIGEPEEDVDGEEVVELSEKFEDSGLGTSVGSSRSPNAREGKDLELGMGDDEGIPENETGSGSGPSSGSSASRLYALPNERFVKDDEAVGGLRIKRKGRAEDMRGESVKKTRGSDGHRWGFHNG